MSMQGGFPCVSAVALSMITQVQNGGAELSVRVRKASALNKLWGHIKHKWIMLCTKILFATMALTCQSPLCYVVAFVYGQERAPAAAESVKSKYTIDFDDPSIFINDTTSFIEDTMSVVPETNTVPGKSHWFQKGKKRRDDLMPREYGKRKRKKQRIIIPITPKSPPTIVRLGSQSIICAMDFNYHSLRKSICLHCNISCRRLHMRSPPSLS